jgi:hypothetical protein
MKRLGINVCSVGSVEVSKKGNYRNFGNFLFQISEFISFVQGNIFPTCKHLLRFP